MPLSSRSRHERRQLAALHALRILAIPPDERFDRITRLATRLFKVRIALVSLVDKHQHWVKTYGLAFTETRRDFCLCAHGTESDQLMVVPDTLNDPRFAINPLVVGEPHIRFYAGHPLIAPNGDRLGTLCLLDTVPRELDRQALASLRDLAVLVEEELYQRELAEVSVRLYQSEVRYRSLFSQAQDGIMLIERGSARVILANQALQSMLGYGTSEMTELNLYDFVAHDPAEVAANLEYCFTADRAPPGERRYRRKDGGFVTVEVSTSILRYYGQETACVIVRDLGKRRSAEQALDEADGVLRALFEDNPCGVLIAGDDGRVKAANPAACRLLGCAAGELPGLSLQDIFDVSDRHTRETLAQASHERPAGGTIIGVRRSGERFTAEVNLLAILDHNGTRTLSITLHDTATPARNTDRSRRNKWPMPARIPIAGLP